MGKGASRERQLRQQFDEAGWGAIRIPGSGSGSNADMADLLVGRDVPDFPGWSDLYAIEAKYRGDQASKSPVKNRKAYLDSEEIDALRRIARSYGATPLIACRWSTRIDGVDHSDACWFFVTPENCYRTPAENYRVSYDTAIENDEWYRFDELLTAASASVIHSNPGGNTD